MNWTFYKDTFFKKQYWSSGFDEKLWIFWWNINGWRKSVLICYFGNFPGGKSLHSSLHLVSLHILLLRHPLIQIRQRNALLANTLPTNALLINALLTNALPTNVFLQTTQINDLFFFFGTFLCVCPRNIFCFTRIDRDFLDCKTQHQWAWSREGKPTYAVNECAGQNTTGPSKI